MSKPFYHLKKRTLLAIAGCVWLVAGFNVARLGIIAYINTTFAFWQPLVSLAVFAAFGTMISLLYASKIALIAVMVPCSCSTAKRAL